MQFCESDSSPQNTREGCPQCYSEAAKVYTEGSGCQTQACDSWEGLGPTRKREVSVRRQHLRHWHQSPSDPG
eukprot:6144769-Karenia_brevis.AAC.1